MDNFEEIEQKENLPPQLSSKRKYIVIVLVFVGILVGMGALLLFNRFDKDSSFLDGESKPKTETFLIEFNTTTTKLAVIPASYKSAPGIPIGSFIEAAFSDNGRQVIYAAQNENGKWLAVVGNKEGKAYNSIDSPVISSDGTLIAYGAQKKEDGNWFMVIGTEESEKTYKNYVGETMISSDGSRVIAIGGRERSDCFITKDKEEACYDGIVSPIFSLDGERVAYIATKEGKNTLVVDGKEGKLYDGIGILNPIFSPDSKHISYPAREEGKWIVVFDDNESVTNYDRIVSVILSPDNKHVAYWATREEELYLVVDSEETKSPYEYIGDIVFSFDGKLMAYIGNTEEDSRIVLNNQEGKFYDSITQGSLTFSPDGKRSAYSAEKNGKWVIVLDGVESKVYDWLSNPVFSPDSEHIGYGARIGNELWWIVEQIY